MIVLLYHLIDRFQRIYFGRNIRAMDFWGSFGVTIFLIISGFFAVNPESVSCKKSEVVFALKKFFLRIWPTYMVCVLITYLLTQIKELPGRTYGLKELITNWLGINHLLGMPYIDGAHWYLTVLTAMFLVVLLFRIFGIHSKPVPYLLWIMMAYIIHCFREDSFLFGGCFVGCYCVGIAIKVLIRAKGSERRKWGGVGVLIAAILETFLTRGAVCTVELVVASVLLLLCLCKKMPFLGCGICAWVGKISYSLYLIHQNVGFWIEYQLMHENDLYKMQYAFIAIVIVFLLAILLFYMVEKPSRKIIEDSKRRKNAVIC